MKRFLTTLTVMILVLASCKKDNDKTPQTAPIVTTAAIINNGSGNITAGGSIVSDGGATVSKSGIVWSRGHATPSLSDSLIESITTNGSFTVNINGIEENNIYYFRAFATNSIGTSFGDVVTLYTGDTSKVRFIYNGQQVEYGIIVSTTTGKKWLDRNLGAKRVATASDDYQAYGDLFQWGRPGDGHQLMNWTSSATGTPVNGTTTTLATSDVPGHSNFITPVYVDDATWTGDWRSDNNKNRWATTPQGPCPAGWHVPTTSEWRAEIGDVSAGGTAGGINSKNSAYSKLKLTLCGGRGIDGHIYSGPGNHPGYTAQYWSSTFFTFNGNTNRNPDTFVLGAGIGCDPDLIASGFSVRCIKDL